MKRVKEKNYFLVAFSYCLIIIFMIFYFSLNMKSTRAHFNGVTGTLTPWYMVTYSSNWPNSNLENEIREFKVKRDYIIIDNMFVVPSGYEFSGWNTQSDGTGDSYLGNINIVLDNDLTLYAQWIVVEDTEEVSFYGDINKDGLIDENDYMLLNDYVSNITELDSQSLLNSDVNDDGKIDLVDVDIIKQSVLGTEGYVGFFPDKIISIYEVYNNIESDSSSSSGSSSGSSSSAGSASTGSGSGNAGSGNHHKNPTSNNKGNGSSNQNKPAQNNNVNNNKDNNNVNVSKVIYEFKYINGLIDYEITTCEADNNLTCELVLPKETPFMAGYSFVGWSLDKDCEVDDKIIAPLIVKSSNTYYACFMELEDNNIEDNKISYVWIIVIFLCVVSFRLICYLIRKFKSEQIR